MTVTKPLILTAMLLLTVIALGVGYMAWSQQTDRSAARGQALKECVLANLDRGDATQYCMARVPR